MQNSKNKKETTISFAGDLSFSAKLQKEYLRNPIDQEILDFMNDSDASIINYESPITDCRDIYSKTTGMKKRLKHRTDPEALEYIKKAFKNPVLSFANNHMNDMSDIGIIDTIENTEESGIQYFGSGRNLAESRRYKIIGEDIKVGIFSFQYKDFIRSLKKPFMGPILEDDLEKIQGIIDELKQNKVDYIVAIYHGGTEFLHIPEPNKRKKIIKYLDMGCDAVISHHPHVVQGYEYIGEKLVMYSLGNFYFDTDYQRVQADTDKGIIVKVIFAENGIKFETKNIRIDRENKRVIPSKDNPYFTNLSEHDYNRLWAKEKVQINIIEENKEKLKDDTAGASFAYEDDNIPKIIKLMNYYHRAGNFENMKEKLLDRKSYIEKKRLEEGPGTYQKKDYYFKVLISKEADKSIEEITEKINFTQEAFGVDAEKFYKFGMHKMDEMSILSKCIEIKRNETNKIARMDRISKSIHKDAKWLDEEAKDIGLEFSVYFFYGVYNCDKEDLRKKLKDIRAIRILESKIRESSYDSSNPEQEIADNYKKYTDLLRTNLSKERIAEINESLREKIEHCDKNEAELAVDVHAAGRIWGYTISEYLIFGFYNKSINERLEYISTKRKNSIINITNPQKDCYLLDDKYRTYERMKDLFGREIVRCEKNNEEEFISFAKKHPVFVKKNPFDSMGKGVEKITLNNKIEEFIDKNIDNNIWFIAEELIEAADELKKLNPDSVNTIRICTYLNKEGDVIIQDAFAKVGRKGSFVDNGGSGGIIVHIDSNTGKFEGDGIDEQGIKYERHPDNGTVFTGYKIPKWKEALEVAIEAAKRIPELRYIGWDLTLNKEYKWIIVEGNAHTQFIGQQIVRGQRKSFEALTKEN